MALLGKAALAMWWDLDPAVLADFQDWHSHEHFRERLGIPGFRRATRWLSADGGPGAFQLYELDIYETLSSPQYLARLNAPTVWSSRMMPHHRNMVRSQCRLLESAGGVVARHVLTVRLAPAPGGEGKLRLAVRTIAATLVDRPGCVGAHLLQHEPPPIPLTAEQKMRGGDRAANWVLIVNGYDAAALQALTASELSIDALLQHGAAADCIAGLYTLSFSATPEDVADLSGT